MNPGAQKASGIRLYLIVDDLFLPLFQGSGVGAPPPAPVPDSCGDEMPCPTLPYGGQRVNTATVQMDDELVRVKIDPISDPSTELWFCEFLTSSKLGVQYQEYDQIDHHPMRLRGYGVLRSHWEHFRFWLGVALVSREDSA